MRRYQNIDFSEAKGCFVSLERSFPEIKIKPEDKKYILADVELKRVFIFSCEFVNPGSKIGACVTYNGDKELYGIPAPHQPKGDELKFRWATVRPSGKFQMFFFMRQRRYDEFWVDLDLESMIYSQPNFNVR